MAKQYTISARIEAEDAASATISKVGDGFEDLGSRAENVAGKLNDMGASATTLAEKLAVNNAVVAEAEKQYAAQAITLEQLREVQASAAQANEELKTSFEGVSSTVGESKKSLDEIGAAAGSAGSAFDQISSAAESFGTEMVASFGAAAAAAIGFHEALKLVDEAAKLEGIKSGLAGVLASTGESVDGYLARITAATNGTVDDFKAASAAMEGFLRGLPIQQIPALFEIARDVANATGVSVEEAFNRISNGVQNASEKSLRMAGVFVDVDKALEKFAAESHKTVEALSQQEKQLATLNGIYESYTERVEKAGKAAATSRIGIEQTIQALKDLGSVIGVALLVPVNALLGALALLTSTILAVGEGVSQFITVLLALGSYLPGVGGAFESLKTSMEGVTTGLDEQRAKFQEHALTLGNWFFGIEAAASATDEIARAQSNLNAEIDKMRDPITILNAEMNKLKASFDAGAITLDEYLKRYDALRLAFETLPAAASRAAPAFTTYTTALDRVREKLFSVKDGADSASAGVRGFDAVVSDLGVVLEQSLVNALAANNLRLVEAEKRYHDYATGVSTVVFTLNDYNAVAKSVAERDADLTRQLEAHVGTLGKTAQAWDGATIVARAHSATLANSVAPATDVVTHANERLVAGLASVASAVKMTSRAFDELSAAQGRTAAVSASLASGGTLSMGGTRIDLPGGGSRLTSPAGFGGTYGSQHRTSDATSRTYIYNPQSGRVEQYG